MPLCCWCFLFFASSQTDAVYRSSVAQSNIFGESEYSMVRFIHKEIPCGCLKDLKRKLKKEPKLTTCMNDRCQTVMEADEFLYCVNCSARYCCAACQKADWKDWHKKICKMASSENHSGVNAAIKAELILGIHSHAN